MNYYHRTNGERVISVILIQPTNKSVLISLFLINLYHLPLL
nr:MAG TPA: hypothetical protein [Caudoviricetes sp.]